MFSEQYLQNYLCVFRRQNSSYFHQKEVNVVTVENLIMDTVRVLPTIFYFDKSFVRGINK